MKDIERVGVLLLPAAGLQPTAQADIIHRLIIHLLQTAGFDLVQLVRDRLSGARNLPQRTACLSQPLQHQLAHAFPRAVHRLAEQLCPQRTQNALWQQQQRHRTDTPFIHQRHHRRRTRKKAHPPKGEHKSSRTAKSSQVGKYPCRQSCQRINSNQLHLWKKCDTDRCSADDAGNGSPALAACQRAQQHRQCSQQSAQRDAAEGDVAQRYNQHRGGQHHADKICPCQGEQTLSQRKRLESPRQKVSTGGCHCRLRQSHHQLVPGKGLCQQRCHRRQQQSKKCQQRRRRCPLHGRFAVCCGAARQGNQQNRRCVFDSQGVRSAQLGKVAQQQAARRTAQRRRRQITKGCCRTQGCAKGGNLHHHIA